MFQARLLMERQTNKLELRNLRNKSRAKAKSKEKKWWLNLASSSVQKCVGDLKAIVESGNLDEGSTWYNYFSDAVHNQKLFLVNNEGLRRSRNSRYSQATMDFCKTTHLVGGPKAVRVLANVQAPDRSTMQRHVTKERMVIHPGMDSRNIAWCPPTWNECRRLLDIPMDEPIALCAEEDETPITMATLLDEKTDRLVGVCGKYVPVVGQRTKHFCDHRHVRHLGSLPEGDAYYMVRLPYLPSLFLHVDTHVDIHGHAHMDMHGYIYMDIHGHIHVDIHGYTCVDMHGCTHMDVHTWTCMDIYTWTCMDVCTWMYMDVHAWMYMDMYTWIYFLPFVKIILPVS
jgi:hypothetical protein